MGPVIFAPPPADDRIVGALRERAAGRTPVADAVIKQLLHNTWLVVNPEDALALAEEHPGARVRDLGGAGILPHSGQEVREATDLFIRGRDTVTHVAIRRRRFCPA